MKVLSQKMASQGAEQDHLSSLPRLSQIAVELHMGVNDLQTHMRNQGLTPGIDDRFPREVVMDLLDRELAAGRPWRPDAKRVPR